MCRVSQGVGQGQFGGGFSPGGIAAVGGSPMMQMMQMMMQLMMRLLQSQMGCGMRPGGGGMSPGMNPGFGGGGGCGCSGGAMPGFGGFGGNFGPGGESFGGPFIPASSGGRNDHYVPGGTAMRGAQNDGQIGSAESQDAENR